MVNGEGGAGSFGASGAGSGKASSAAATSVGSLTQDEAALQSHSVLLELQQKMQSDYLARLSESSFR